MSKTFTFEWPKDKPALNIQFEISIPLQTSVENLLAQIVTLKKVPVFVVEGEKIFDSKIIHVGT